MEDIAILVGGLPADRNRPFGYAIVFSAADVIEEYTRPARVVEDGRTVTRPALSEVETIEVPGVGTLEAFLTDGLRTLLSTVRARAMKEKPSATQGTRKRCAPCATADSSRQNRSRRAESLSHRVP